VTEKTSSAGVTPQLAGVQDALKDAPSLQPTYGPGAEDLLADVEAGLARAQALAAPAHDAAVSL